MTMVEILDLWGPVQAFDITQPVAGHVRLYGFSVRETSGAAVAQVLVTNAPNGGGTEWVSVNLNASGADRDWFGPNSVDLPNGYFPQVTGAVKGAVFLRIMGGGG